MLAAGSYIMDNLFKIGISAGSQEDRRNDGGGKVNRKLEDLKPLSCSVPAGHLDELRS